MYENTFLVLGVVIGLANLLAFVLVGKDKAQSVARAERFPEVSFFFFAVFFSALGVLLGMFAFRHKTRKLYFPLGIGVLLIQQILLVYALWRLWG